MRKVADHKNVTKSKIAFLKYLDKIIQPEAENLVVHPKMEVQEGSAVYISQSTHTKTLSVLGVVGQGFPDKIIAPKFVYSPIDTITSARNGVKFNDFKNIYDLMKLPNNKWAEIMGVSERTMQSILKEKRNLDQNKSEKLISFLTLIEYALDVLGNKENVQEWLHYKSPALQGKAPVEYVDTFQGITMLREELFKIDSGNLA
ncbi:MAG: antitoxin Xre-like helix-turn-helix domain-containing protein [Bacteroidota bacterium]